MKVQNTITSSFNGIQRYTGKRGNLHPSVFDWLEAKRRDDNIGPKFWRVHDKLYDLEDFIKRHPGGSDWIEFSRGTDITEAFESSHFVNVANVEKTLAKFYVADAKCPRNSPYTFKENGFYKTLKRKAEPILKEVGMEPSKEALFIQDALVLMYITFAITGAFLDSAVLLILAGTILGMATVCAHNLFHKKDNWRIYYYDLSTLSSDYEILLGEPLVEMLPTRPKFFLHKYIMPLIVDALYTIFGFIQIPVRLSAIIQGKQKLRPENMLVILELVVFLLVAPSIWSGFKAWAIIVSSSSFWFAFVSNNSAHHHPDCFHDGDESRPNPDFGLCQIDATAYKTDWYHRSLFSVLTTFGEHPLHHLFPTVCHGKLKFLKHILDETLTEFSEDLLEFTQWQLFVGTHKQLGRTTTHPFRKNKKN